MSSRPDLTGSVTPIFGATTGRYKPEAAKHVQGTYRKDRAKEEAKYTKVDSETLPTPPDWMVDPIARACFCEHFELMRDAGILTAADIPILEVWAAEKAMLQRRYEQAYRITEDPDTGEKVYEVLPMMAPGNEKLNAFRVLCSELGFTPVSRHKVTGNKGKKGEEDPWAQV